MRLFLLLPLIGCAPLAEIPSGQAVQGAAVGAAATAAVVKAKEVLEPHYPLYLPPAELCRPDSGKDGKPDMEGKVICIAIPCRDDSACKTEYSSVQEFLITVRSVIPVTSYSDWLGSVSVFCKKHPDLCEQHFGEYQGKKFMILSD